MNRAPSDNQIRTQFFIDALEPRTLFAAGDLDPTFGAGGIAFARVRDVTVNSGDLVVQPDGKILFGGIASENGGYASPLLVRFNPDGTRDASFGNDGVVVDPTAINNLVAAIALQPDGKIVAGGAFGFEARYSLARYTAAGELDTSFGEGGLVAMRPPGRSGSAWAVRVLPDGKILVGGPAAEHWYDHWDFMVARLNPDGSPDQTFGNAGYAIAETPVNDELYNIAVLPDGKIAAVGDIGGQFGIARFTADGAIDRSFGPEHTGVVTTDFGRRSIAYDVAALPDGRLLAGGARMVRPYDISNNLFLSDVAMARYLADGSLDPTFGDGGRVIREFTGDAYGYIESLAVNAAGRIITAGAMSNIAGYISRGAVMSFLPDGRPDPTFGDGGSVLHQIGQYTYFGEVALQSDGRPVVLARLPAEQGSGTDYAVLRFLGPSTPLTARAGGPFFLDEGQRVILDGTASGDPDAPIVAFEWDLDYDGATFDVDASNATVPVYTPAGIDGRAGARTVAFRVRDSRGEVSNVSTTTMTVRNVAPTATIEGATGTRPEGSPVHLVASATDPSDADTAAGFTYAWTVTRGGQTVATGTTRELTFTPADDGAYVVALAVTDKDGGTGTATATIMVSNQDPTLRLADPTPSNPVPWQTVRFGASVSDPGAGDRLEVAWDFGDGVTLPFRPLSAGGLSQATHVYRKTGVYTVTATVRDDDGATVTRSVTLTIESVAIQAAPCDPAQRWLAVGGTAGDDRIQFSAQGHAVVRVTLNGRRSDAFSDVRRIFAFGGPGNDSISAPSSVRAPAVFDGGAGNDLLDGGGGDDVLLGGDGRDLLLGLHGRDTLVGGAGADLLVGTRSATRIEGDADVTVTCAGVTVTPVRRRPPRDG